MYKGKKFNREQLVFMVNTVLIAAIDRVDSALPDDATNKVGMRDYKRHQVEIADYIGGCVATVAMALPVIFAQLDGDGMGVGDFTQFEQFHTMVDNHIKAKTDPIQNRIGNVLMLPDTTPLAEAFVDEYLKHYLKTSKKVLK